EPRSAESTKSLPAHGGSRSTDDRLCVVWAAWGARARFSFHCASVSNGPHRAIGPFSALLTFLISHFRILNHSHFNGFFRVVQQLLVILAYVTQQIAKRVRISERPFLSVGQPRLLHPG